jgi:hypothetical protein
MSALGNIACLSGPTTYVGLESLLAIWTTHVKECTGDDLSLYEYWLFVLGEDGHLTQGIGARFGAHCMEVHTGTVYETAPAIPLGRLIKQRRRWFLGGVANEAAFLCNARFWADTPFLSLWKLYMLATVSDLQAILLSLTLTVLRVDMYSWLLPTTILCLIADGMILRSVDGIRQRVGVLIFPVGRLLFPIIESMAVLWALFTACRRQW